MQIEGTIIWMYLICDHTISSPQFVQMLWTSMTGIKKVICAVASDKKGNVAIT